MKEIYKRINGIRPWETEFQKSEHINLATGSGKVADCRGEEI